MRPTEIAREALFPLTDLTVVMTIIIFGSLFWLASVLLALGPLFMIVGLLLGMGIVTALIRYAIYLLEARAHGKKTPVADIGIFSFFDDLWALFPLLLLAGMAGLGMLVAAHFGPVCNLPLLIVLSLFFPASVAVLGITHSPLASVNPVSLSRMIRACGISYLWIPLLLTIVFLAAWFPGREVLPGFVTYLLGTYVFLLLFTLTGAVVHASGVAREVSVDMPAGQTASTLADALLAERRKVANHAYGFVSRGNRDGGFKHIRQWLATEPDPDDAVQWFLNEMLTWEKKESALFFGQECFAHFLHHGEDTLALKTATRCLYEDPRWRPRAQDRQHAIDLAQRHARGDLLESLRD